MQTDRMDQVPRVEGSGCQLMVPELFLFPATTEDMIITLRILSNLRVLV